MKFNKLIPELSVSNLNESLKFYVNSIGFKIEYQRPENKFVFISYQGTQFMLQELEENEKWSIGELKTPIRKWS